MNVWVSDLWSVVGVDHIGCPAKPGMKIDLIQSGEDWRCELYALDDTAKEFGSYDLPQEALELMAQAEEPYLYVHQVRNPNSGCATVTCIWK
jgi:hypothetical protein